jgi:hypothetical protein
VPLFGRCGVTGPGIGWTVAGQDDQGAILGVEKSERPYGPGLPDGRLNGGAVGHEGAVSLVDGYRLLFRHQRLARATDDQQRETQDKKTRAQGVRDSTPYASEQQLAHR